MSEGLDYLRQMLHNTNEVAAKVMTNADDFEPMIDKMFDDMPIESQEALSGLKVKAKQYFSKAKKGEVIQYDEVVRNLNKEFSKYTGNGGTNNK